jgi:5-methylcytosine-specific restriction protein A
MAWSRESRHKRGYGTEWDKLRDRYMREHPLCAHCLAMKPQRVTEAAHLDHVTPKAKGGTDADENLQALCKACHKLKTLRDRGVRPRVEFDTEGNPLWE